MGHKILIVEDEAIVALHEEENLKSLGYKVVGKASSGEEAVRKAEETRPDLVLMDIVLKGEMDGIEAAEKIRTSFDIPVIYVTAYGDELTLQRAGLTEPFGYILKPFKERDLHVAIRIGLHKHKLESKLKSLTRWFAATLRSIGDAVITTDQQGRISFMNHTAEKMSRWRRKDAIGKRMTDVIGIINSEDRPLEFRHLEQIISDGIVINISKDYNYLRTKEGARLPIGGCAAPISDDRGNIIGMVMVLHDFSEFKALEEALRVKAEKYRQLSEALEQRVKEAVAELRQKDQMLMVQCRHAVMGEMLSNIAHQWRQPLNMLGLLAQELQMTQKSTGLSEEFIEVNVKKTLDTIRHMSKTIDDFRSFFKPGTQRVDFLVFDTIEKALTLLEGSFKMHSIKTEVIRTGDPVINGYPGEFIQVLLNILINARDALIERRVASPLISINLSTQDGKTVVSIADNAGGIPEDIIDKVFDPYFTTKGPQQGTGIGLFMSKNLIEKNMNGLLSARNVADGAEFRIEI